MKQSILAALSLSYTVLASPLLAKRQNIDFDAYESVEQKVPVAAPVGVASAEVVASIVYDPAAAANSAIQDAVTALTVTSQAPMATFDTVQTIVQPTIVPTAAATVAAVAKRAEAPVVLVAPADGSGYRTSACTSAQPAGNGPATTGPDTPTAFLNNKAYSDASNNAAVPNGYTLLDSFKSRFASAQDPSYLTYTMSGLTTYNPGVCSALCDKTPGCFSFNLYYERVPTYDPNSGCPNPPSATAIKCAIYGAPLTGNSATNVGQFRNKFQVVIAGSNGYVKNAPPAIPGFTGPVSLGNASIQVDYSYIGNQVFDQKQPFDPSVCAAACLKTTQFDRDHINKNGIYDTCRFFNAYTLYKNGAGGVFTCAYYTLGWGQNEAKNFGQYNGKGDHFTIQNSYAYTLNTVQNDMAKTDNTGVSYYVYTQGNIYGQWNLDTSNFKGTNYIRKGTYSNFLQQIDFSPTSGTQQANVLHGFFNAPQAGTYTFTSSKTDDIFYFWHGDTALKGWTAQNADLHSYFDPASAQTASTTITLPKGYPLPVTMLYANSAYIGALGFTIKYPDGTQKSDMTGLFVPPNVSNNPFEVPA